jgi:hypothetical protein
MKTTRKMASYSELEQTYLALSAQLPADFAGLTDDELAAVVTLMQEISDLNHRMTAIVLREPVLIRSRAPGP